MQKYHSAHEFVPTVLLGVTPQSQLSIGKQSRSLFHLDYLDPADPAWISLATSDHLRRQWKEIESLQRQGKHLPLFGVPFAVKDNIDGAGLPTTAACPDFSYLPTKDAEVVRALRAAGTVLIGKTNLDALATGLIGTRSPYGAVPNTFNSKYISGGSSSGSASVVARGFVPFALGTDTAGSGRVPAGLNNILGLKATRGALSARGVVPACRTLDCVSILALTIADASVVFHVAASYDPQDSYSRAVIAFSLLFKLANLLYEGPWVAESFSAIEDFIVKDDVKIDPVVRGIIQRAHNFSAVDFFDSEYRKNDLIREIEVQFQDYDAILVPTDPLFPTHEDIKGEPVLENARLGRYTNFVNFLDWTALSVPAGFRTDGLPFGLTIISTRWQEEKLTRLGSQWLSTTPRQLGATQVTFQDMMTTPKDAPGSLAMIPLVVVGAHLSGVPLNAQLTDTCATFRCAEKTSCSYRLYQLASTTNIRKPDLRRVVEGEEIGLPIDVEVWDISTSGLGTLMSLLSSPLAIGSVELSDGEWMKGFFFWRTYVQSLTPPETLTPAKKSDPKPLFNSVLIANRGDIAVRIISTLKKLGIRPGQILEASFPEGVRVDTWIKSVSIVSPAYDPLLAKVFVCAYDRPEAIRKLAAALENTTLSGLQTNLEYLKQILQSHDFQNGTYQTNTLDSFKYQVPAFEVLDPGPSTTVQDYPGRQADLECTRAGPALLFHRDAYVCIVGGQASLEIDGTDASLSSQLYIKAGQNLKLGEIKTGCRAYISVKGGISVPPFLGSRSTFALGKIGGHCGRELRVGNIIPFDQSSNTAPIEDVKSYSTILPKYGKSWVINVLPGPHAFSDSFSESAFAELFQNPRKVHYNSNRVGVRLTGPKPTWARSDGLSFRIYACIEAHKEAPIPGVVELTPGVRSLHVAYNSSQDEIVAALQAATSVFSLESFVHGIPSRTFILPPASEDSASLAAVQRYSQTIRENSPWLPSNVDFLQRINGLETKPWIVGIGGQYLCIYGIESPGGYQLVGRTVPIWNRWAKREKPWMFNIFDQIRFYPISEEKLIQARELGQDDKLVTIVDGTFDIEKYERWLEENAADIASVTNKRRETLKISNPLSEAMRPGTSQLEANNQESMESGNGIQLRAGIAGRCWKAAVGVGDVVEEGQTLFWIEAMKMEIKINAPIKGTFSAVFVKPGDVLGAESRMATLVPL
ncbi:Urea amidolyase [Lachnellula suecica]|uniref:Urea amidolyase n=1 Tax=Lachnellula suecica TaxID=602035 RepID=A0A8T9C1U6_9HELO|nr:Urea amidolyase [Lachnellula suecica]